MKYRADIDGLRTIAVLPVVIYHAGLGLSGGFVGVDVFFVISGFLITYLLIDEIENRNFSILRFYERRARRLFPAMFVMLAVTAIASIAIMVPFDLLDFGLSLAATALFAANIWFYSQEGYFTEAAELEPLLHTWSLGVEEQYYILFPVILFIVTRLLRPGLAFAVITGLALVSFIAAAVTLSMTPEAAFYLPHLRAWELLIGSLLAIMIWRGWYGAIVLPLWLIQTLAALGFIAILWPVLSYGHETPFPGLAALPPCIGAALLIAVGTDRRSFSVGLLSWPPMVFIGKLSYSLYLWHWPLISLTFYQFGPLTPAMGVACLLISCVLAYLSWRYVEQPFRDRNRIGKPVVLIGSIGAIFASSAIGIALWKLEGLPNRMDPDLLAMAVSDNYLHDRRDCHLISVERVQADELCLRGAQNVEPSFMLIGDSHADALSPAVFVAAEDLGGAGYQFTGAGFAPLPGVWRLGRQDPGIAEALIEFVQARPSIKTLIVTRFWEHQLTGYSYRHNGAVWVDEEYDGSGVAYNETATRNGFLRLAERLPDRQIVLLDDIPSGTELHIRHQLRQMRLGNTDNMGLNVAARDAQKAIYEPILIDLAAQAPNLHYRQLFLDLCDEEHCPLFDGDTLLFRDGDHLSWEGALRLTGTARDLLLTLPTAPP